MNRPDNLPSTNTITTWRAVIDQLTPAQIAGYQQAEALLDTRQPEELVAQALLAQQARDDAEANRIDRERFGHIPAPVGADRTYHWTLDPQTGRWSREWAGATQHVGGIVVGVEGIQHTDATITSQVILSGDGAALTANQARHLAAALLQAAEETDRHNGPEGTVQR